MLLIKGGGTVKDSVRMMMGSLFTNKLLTEMNWTGKNECLKVATLLLTSLITSKYFENI